PFAGAAKAGHYFIGNQQDAVLVAQRAQSLHVTIRRNQDAVRPDYGLDDYRCDCLRAFEFKNLFGARQNFFGRVRTFLNAVIEVGNAKDAGDPGLRRPAARITGQRQSSRSAAVIGAIARANLVTPAEHARYAYRVLVCFGAAVGEKKCIDVAGRDLGKLHTNRARTSVAINGFAYGSTAACSWMARTTRSSPWPMLTHISWLLKSMKRFPSGVQK